VCRPRAAVPPLCRQVVWRWLLCGVWLLSVLGIQLPAAHAATTLWAPFEAVQAVTVQTSNESANLRFATTIAMDERGRMWMGGYSSLVRLDGVAPKVYSQRNTPAFSQAHIRALLPLAGGGMLVGTNREGVLRWDLASGEFEALPVDEGQSLTRIHGLSHSRDGGAWIAAENGLFHWPAKPGHKATRIRSSVLDAMESSRIFSVVERENGALWVAAHAGILVRDAGEDEFSPLKLADGRLDARVAGEAAWLLDEDASGRMWVGLLRSGVVVIDPDSLRSFAPEGLDGVDGLHQGRTIRTFLHAQGKTWIGTDGQGLLSCAADCRMAKQVKVNLSTYDGGRGFYVRTLLEDRQGRIWAASDRGVFHFEPAPKAVLGLDVNPSWGEAHSQGNTVRTVFYDATRQRLWLGMDVGVIQVFDLATGVRHLVTLPAPLAGSLVSVIRSDASGRIWAAGNGVVWIDPVTLEVSLAGELGRAPVWRVNDLAIEGDRVWLALYDGIAEVDLKGTLLRRMTGTRGTGLHVAYITQLGKTPNALWASSQDGLYRVDLQRWRAERVPEPEVPAESRSGVSFINTIATRGDDVWAGTAKGAWHTGLSGSGFKPSRLLDTPLGEIEGVFHDGEGDLWLLGQEGAGRLDRNNRLTSFSAASGYVAGGVLRNTVVKGPQGSVVFSTNAGVTVLMLEQLQAEVAYVPDLSPVVTAMQLDGRTWADGVLPTAGKGLSIPPEHERLIVEFSAIDFLSSPWQRYAYRLEGHDSRWTELEEGALPIAMYSRLPAGEYQLAMRVTSNVYPGREWVTSLPIQVLPRWYESTATRVLGLLSILGLMGLLLWARDAQARSRRRVLEHLVDTRTHELSEANKRLDRLAGEDVLTGLLSRGRLLERLEQLRAEACRHPRSDTLVLLDMDHFKKINDGHGHAAGDEVLREVARRIRVSMRTEDFSGRYGGEELLVVLPKTTLQEAAEPITRIWNAIRAEPVNCNGVSIHISASLGVAEALPDESIAEWVARADAALYQAKAMGRDRIECAGNDLLV
jgi:diguanylate cyclase (GGDEF)-like protein